MYRLNFTNSPSLPSPFPPNALLSSSKSKQQLSLFLLVSFPKPASTLQITLLSLHLFLPMPYSKPLQPSYPPTQPITCWTVSSKERVQPARKHDHTIQAVHTEPFTALATHNM